MKTQELREAAELVVDRFMGWMDASGKVDLPAFQSLCDSVLQLYRVLRRGEDVEHVRDER